jgi:hypothetical protein
MEAAKSFTCQTVESAWITVMDRQILGPGLRQHDPVSLPSCRQSPRLKLVQHEKPPVPVRAANMKMLRRLVIFQVDASNDPFPSA